MMKRRHHSFTLIELVTYMALLSSSLTLLMSFELASQKAINSQRAAGEIAAQADALFRMLTNDVQQAQSIQVSEDRQTLILQTSAGESIHYESRPGKRSSCLQRRIESATGTRETILLRVVEHRFSYSTGAVPLLTVKAALLRERRRADEVQSQPVSWTIRPLVGLRRSLP